MCAHLAHNTRKGEHPAARAAAFVGRGTRAEAVGAGAAGMAQVYTYGIWQQVAYGRAWRGRSSRDRAATTYGCSPDHIRLQAEQLRVISDFRGGVVNVLVATSVAEEGLDIGEVSSKRSKR